MVNAKQSDLDAMAANMLACRDNPELWVEAMGDDPWEGQREILRAVATHNEVAVRSCHGMGKDWISARLVLWFLYHHAPSLVLTTGPTDRQVKGILWKEIGVAHSKAGLPGKCNTQDLKLARDHYAVGFTAPAHDDTRFQGFHEENIMVVIDEASGVSPEIYASIESVLTSRNTIKLEIGNPTDPLSTFAASFKDPNVYKISISAYETPNFTEFGIVEADILDGSWKKKIGHSELPRPKLVTPDWVARVTSKWGVNSSLYKSRVMGQFPDESPDSLIPLSWVERCTLPDDEVMESIDSGSLPVEIGVDVAYEGDDHTVIVLRQGNYARIVHRRQGHDLMETTGHCVRLRRAYRATAIKVDCIGLGAGVVNRLSELNEPVHACNCAHNSIHDESYSNKKAEWLWLLSKRFEKGTIVLDKSSSDEMAAELTAFRWTPDSNGRVKIESKKEMKKRLHGRSPDSADALAIAFSDVDSGDAAVEGAATCFL